MNSLGSIWGLESQKELLDAHSSSSQGWKRRVPGDFLDENSTQLVNFATCPVLCGHASRNNGTQSAVCDCGGCTQHVQRKSLRITTAAHVWGYSHQEGPSQCAVYACNYKDRGSLALGHTIHKPTLNLTSTIGSTHLRLCLSDVS